MTQAQVAAGPSEGELLTLDDMRDSTRATITLIEAAAVLEVDPRTVSGAVADGSIPSISVGRRKKIPREKFLEMFET